MMEAIIWQLNTKTLLALFTAELPVTQNCGSLNVAKCVTFAHFAGKK